MDFFALDVGSEERFIESDAKEMVAN